jgi:hypothetical protein
MREFADRVVRLAKGLGLYAITCNDQFYYVQKPDSTELKRNDDGTPYVGRLAGLKPNMTVNYARREHPGMGETRPALQIELTNLLRVTPVDAAQKDKRSRIVGVALGYKLLEGIVGLAFADAA